MRRPRFELPARKLVAFGVAALALLAAPRVAGAHPVVTIGNGPAAPDGSYINATNLRQNLLFTNVTVTAENEVRYPDVVNIGTTTFGTNSRNITHTAPTLSVLADVQIGNGNFDANNSHVNLSAAIRDQAGALIASAARLPGVAATVSVGNNAANLQQAIWFTQSSAGVSTVTALFGSSTSLVFDSDTRLILSGGQVSGSVAMNHAGSLLELHGSIFELDTGPGFIVIGKGPVNALSGQLRGKLDSGETMLVSFTQGGPGRIQIFAPQVPIGDATWIGVVGALGLVGSFALRRRRPSAGPS